MFDIDGTLNATFAVDADCYVRALAEVSGLETISTDWASYQHTTDSGILDEVYQSRLGRPPQLDEICAVRDRFIQLLNQAVSTSRVSLPQYRALRTLSITFFSPAMPYHWQQEAGNIQPV
jgi:hypothetical protein